MSDRFTFTKGYVWGHIVLWPILFTLCFATGAWFAGALFAVSWVACIIHVIKNR